MLIPGWLTRLWQDAQGAGMGKGDTGRVLASAPKGTDAAQHLSRAPWQRVAVMLLSSSLGTEAAPHLSRAPMAMAPPCSF